MARTVLARAMSPRGRLEGKRAVIAGVGPGMGSAIAARFADEGAAVVVTARRNDAITALVETIRRRGGTAHPLVADVADPAQAERLATESARLLGGPADILVNAAGAWTPAATDADEPAVVDRMLHANLRTLLTITPPFARSMQAAGGGAILNIAAAAGGAIATRGQAAYNATKAGVVGYTRAAAADLLAHRIRVNCLLPGATSHDWAPDRDPATRRTLGTDRIGAPEDVAAAAVFLVSDEAAWITGAQLLVDGGESVRTG